MKKKVLSLVLALLMAASSASAVLADEAIADVEETAVVEEVAEAGQYDKAIAFLANYGIFKGISADDLGADLDVNRYQMALFVGRVSTGWVDDDKWEDGPENWSEFTDISEGAVANYWGALSYANAKGIIEGYGNGKFGPYDGITYQNALTMVVRTLGYTGLEWPWGYIEKAVSLGLTDGITDVAYTDELTRGETAQIIYNALFAKTKAGDTLAMSSFGIEFGWEKVIVTASDLNTFTKDNKGAAIVVDDSKYTVSYKDSNKPAAGVVSFQILNDDGTLADDVYYVAAKDLGLDADHADELAVGDAYYVLFEQDKNAKLVDVVAYESLYTETLVNAGKTDDEGEAADYAIDAWLKDVTLVDKYATNNYINMTKSGKDEVIVYTADNSALEIITGTDYMIAVDLATGNILVPKDGKDTAGNKWDSDKYDETKAEFTVKYTWSDIFDCYYTVVADGSKIAIDKISDDEIEKLFKDYTKNTTAKVAGFDKAATSLVKSAYAALDLFDTNLDGVADRGIYETYRLGYFENKTVDYGCGHGKLDSYVITDVDTLAQALDAYKAKEGKDSSETKVSITVREEGVTCKCDNQRAWIVDDSVLVDAVDEEGEETGYYAAGYVLYNYDAETGALKVVKNITDGEDTDSFVQKGIVRGYNVTKKTITIDDETYDINGYSELLGNGFRYADDSTAAKAVYGAFLEGLFNQFVEFVVVDDELVHVEAIGADTNDVIVVESYAGISKDGYIVVNGYSTDDLKYDQFRLGSIEGWEEGDIYYYLKNYAGFANDSLRGVVFSIASYDKAEDVYFVNYAGGNNNSKWDVESGVSLTPAYLIADTNNYMVRGYGLKDGETDVDDIDSYKTSDVKMKEGDKYIIVRNSGNDYAPIVVYVGKLNEGEFIKGDVIKYVDDSTDTYVFVNAVTNIAIDMYDAGIVLLAKGFKDGADYDKNLLGASEYAVTAFDFLTGNTVSKVAVNDALKAGNFYFTQGDVIENKIDVVIEDEDDLDVDELIAAVNNTFAENDTYVAWYFDLLAEGEIVEDCGYEINRIFDNTKDKDYNEEALEYLLLNEGMIDDDKFRDDKVDSIKYFTLTIEDGKAAVKAFNVADNKGLANFKKFVEDGSYTYLESIVVYNKDNKDAVVYIVVDDQLTSYTEKAYTISTEGTTEDDIVVYEAVLAENEGMYVKADVTVKEEKIDDTVIAVAVTGVTFTWTGTDKYFDADGKQLTGVDHVADDLLNFGTKATTWNNIYADADCKADTTTNSTLVVTVAGEEVDATIDANGTYDADCNLVKSIKVALVDEIFVDETFEVTVENDAANGTAQTYTFTVDVVDNEVVVYAD